MNARPPGSTHGRDRTAGILIISLDFELMWGVRDRPFAADYEQNLVGARTALPRILDIFREYGVHATWATVGFLFCENRDELLTALPDPKPSYRNPALSPYDDVERLENEDVDPLHFASSLVELIASYPHQEIATHTFSHYYCLEDDQDVDAFRADLTAAVETAKRKGYRLESLVFPRNQLNPLYLEVCRDVGITSYRGVERSWLYTAKSDNGESLLRRGIRLVDAYINVSGRHTFRPELATAAVPANIPSSRFLRPYTRSLRLLEPLKRRRIKADLTYAATHGEAYHLWWHPHNFGAEPDESIEMLRGILEHFAELRDRHGMRSLNMGELAREGAAPGGQ